MGTETTPFKAEFTIPEHFTASPVKRVKFSDGKVLTLNRKQRRKAHIYNRDLKPVKRG
ncbi:MAG: hypothetical protein WC455_20785 [Dehalococcoidia bacterium]|jgi:hypothetical protein